MSKKDGIPENEKNGIPDSAFLRVAPYYSLWISICSLVVSLVALLLRVYGLIKVI